MIDGGIFLGRDPTTGIGGAVEQTLARLRKNGAASALAVSFRGIYFDTKEGNAETLALAARHPQAIIPGASLNMYAFDAGTGSIARLKAEGFRALVVFAHAQGWSYGDYVFRVAAREAEAAGLPLQAIVRTREELAQVARAAPESKILVRWLKGGGYNAVPDMIAVAGDCRRFVFDVSTVCQSGGIEHLVARIGADKLYLASSAPLTLDRTAYFILRAARLADVDRVMIESGTLARVLGVPKHPPAPEPEGFSALKNRPKLDNHWHTSGWNIIEPRIDFTSISRDLDDYNIRIAVTSSIRALNDDIATGNAETAEFLKREPRARGLIVVNPLTPESSIAEIEKYRTDPAFVGIKTIQDFYRLRLDHPGYRQILDHVRRHPALPLMAHLPGMAEAAELYPDVRFVAAHATWNYAPLIPLGNVWFDIATSTSLREEADIGALIAAAGPERVMYSSDAQLMAPAWTLGKLASLDLPESILDQIFRKTIRAAFPRLADGAPP
jgi:predicted TIM-barrel fold metal-dependent hydrolase